MSFARNVALVFTLLLSSIVTAPAAPLRQATVEIAASGLGGNAALLRQALVPRINAVLAANSLPDFGPGTRLVVRITSVFFNSSVPSGGNNRFFGSNESATSDFLEGDILVIGPRGRVVAQTRLLVNAPTFSAGAWYAQGFGERRIAQLADAFAYWLPRRLQGLV